MATVPTTAVTVTVEAPRHYNERTLRISASWLTQNQARRMHWAAKRELVAVWKTKAFFTAHQLRTAYPRLIVPIPDRVNITVTPHKSGRAFDSDAVAPTAKACIDGLVLAGVLADDSPRYVAAITYRPVIKAAGTKADPDRVVITLNPESETTP